MNLNKRKLHSIGLGLALVAPFIYLFGTMFALLGGSHGTQLIAEEEPSIVGYDTSFVYGNESYTRPFYNGDSNRYFEYTFADSYENPTFVYLSPVSFISFDTEHQSSFSFSGFSLPSTNDYLVSLTVETQDWYVEEFYLENQAFSIFVEWNGDWLYVQYIWSDSLESGSALTSSDERPFEFSWQDFATTYETYRFYLDYVPLYARDAISTLYSPSGVYLMPFECEPIYSDTEKKEVSYEQYLFGQWFSDDNFLSKSGRDVIADNPNYGFVPFGELFRFLDSNMMHLSSLNYGYLVIGYLYYVAHVFLVDLMLMVLVGLFSLIAKPIELFDEIGR